jgi:hypothetical protein
VVLRCKNVVIGWFLTWWEIRNGAGFVVFGAKKIAARRNAPQMGQLMLSGLSSAGLSNAGRSEFEAQVSASYF